LQIDEDVNSNKLKPKYTKPSKSSTDDKNEEHKSYSSPQPKVTLGNSRRTGWKLVFGISVVLFVIWVAQNGEKNKENISKKPQSISLKSYENQSTKNTLAQEIELGKTRAKQIEKRILDMDNRLERYERRMKYYLANNLENEYNQLVPSYNSLVSDRDDLYEKYKRLINKININIRRYNLGYR